MQKIAVVTGTSKGIGQTISEMLLAEGWEVFGVSRTPNAKFSENTKFHQIIADLSNVDGIKAVCDALPEKIDLLVNNAGGWELVLVKDITPEHFDKMISVNLRAPVLLTSSLLPRLDSGSVIINISSIMSRYTEPEYGVYASAKAGVDRFTTTLAKERKDLKVVGILPSATDTPANRNTYGDKEDYSTYLSPNEVASVVMRVVNGEFDSGNLIVINNTEFAEMWTNRDKYIVVDVDSI
jgi:NAD(P)-dependent dehydrogenase (short-subunit alcohol dehydrogenase family)